MRLRLDFVGAQAVKEVDAVRLRGEAVKRRRTHRPVSAVSWPMEFGMGPVKPWPFMSSPVQPAGLAMHAL